MRALAPAALLAAALAVTAPAAVTAGAERYLDEIGDATGDAPDVVAVTIDEPEGPLLSISIELATEPPLSADEDHTDGLWVVLDTDPEVTMPELDGFTIGTLGATLSEDLERGGHLLAGEDLYWHVVDVAVDGPTVTFRVDRKLLGDPVDLYFRVHSTALQNEPAGDEVDLYPEEGEPAASFRLRKEWE
jgi:hypothetical protein